MTHKTTILCEKCEGKVKGLLNELVSEAHSFKRGTLILDCLYDLWCCLEEGNIRPVRSRDRAYKQGKRVGRRLTPKSQL